MMVDFEWDPTKAKANLEKHGVDFADAVVALEDDLAPHGARQVGQRPNVAAGQLENVRRSGLKERW